MTLSFSTTREFSMTSLSRPEIRVAPFRTSFLLTLPTPFPAFPFRKPHYLNTGDMPL